jgi:hypothetical protein
MAELPIKIYEKVVIWHDYGVEMAGTVWHIEWR